jgi:putative SOS response-associated peptidase YedK
MGRIGRYSITKRRKDVEREVASKLRVRLRGGDEHYERFNVAPTQDVPAVVQDRQGRRAELLRWGLVPRWARELNTGLSMINARAETLATSRAFGGLVERPSHRCLVLADGFYEWIASEDPKQPRLPLHFTLAGGRSFCFAGLWTTWKDSVRSCAVVTVSANELVAPAHDRMPVVLAEPAAWEAWLDPALDAAAVAPLLVTPPAESMQVTPANPVMNHPDHEGPDSLVAP